VEWLIVAVWVWVVVACFTSYIARQRGRSFFEALAFGLILGPLGLIAVAALPEREPDDLTSSSR
jgi:NhaP-type Na+/H+ or K+/H+ antiporter